MDTQSSFTRALKPAQEQEVAEDWRCNPEQNSSTCCRDFGTKEEESHGREVVLGTLFKLLVKDKLLYNGKEPVNAELRPLRREKRGTMDNIILLLYYPWRNGSSAIRHFERSRDDEDVTE